MSQAVENLLMDIGHKNEFDPVLMELAERISKEGNCKRRSVGAVIARNGTVLTTGVNGVASKFIDCIQAGCPRCISGGSVGMGYDLCICIHGEQKAVANAARDGVAVGGSTMYVNVRPCLSCLVVIHHAGVRRVFFKEDWSYPPSIEAVYQMLASAFEVFEHRELCGSSSKT